MKPIKEGKVREIYDNGDSLIMVATDRISCFDVILKNVIEKKGTVLTQMSKFWFDMTEDIVPNHMISVDVNDMPEFFRQPKFDGNSMMCKKLEMLPIECIVRGYITGSGWASYQENGTVCGIKLPEGLKESDKLPEPIYTPSTKAEIGDHDENISYEESIKVLEKQFPGKGEEYAAKLKLFLDSGCEEQMTKNKQQRSYISALAVLNQQFPDQTIYYVERINMLIICGQLEEARKACQEFSAQHADKEEPILMEIKLYQALHDAKKLQERVQALKALPKRLSPEALRIIRFWDKEVVHA